MAAAAQRVRVHEAAGDEGDAKAPAPRAIERLVRRLGRTALVALAYRAAADPFGKIRGLVEDMISKLMQEAADAAAEATLKAFGDKELGESQASQADKEAKQRAEKQERR